jgi:hypothetical protein
MNRTTGGGLVDLLRPNGFLWCMLVYLHGCNATTIGKHKKYFGFTSSDLESMSFPTIG